MVQLFYTPYIPVGLAHHEIVRAKIGKDNKINTNLFLFAEQTFLEPIHLTTQNLLKWMFLEHRYMCALEWNAKRKQYISFK